LILSLGCGGFVGACAPAPHTDTQSTLSRLQAQRAAAEAVMCANQSDHCHVETMTVGNVTVSVAWWKAMDAAVRNVASFEMSCAQDKLQLVMLASEHLRGPLDQVYDSPTQVGVTGCGQRRAYTRFGDRWTSGGPATTGAPAASP
jgi:hypothetical protein